MPKRAMPTSSEIETILASEYVKAYTSGDRILLFKGVWHEVKELIDEILKMDRRGIAEEWGDVVLFIQLWLYWRFGLDGLLWRSSYDSVRKFMGRLCVWQDLYVYVGLDRHVSNFCGNYFREHKVVKQLGKFGIDAEKAQGAYQAIVVCRVSLQKQSR